jgi:hypothetical protein
MISLLIQFYLLLSKSCPSNRLVGAKGQRSIAPIHS